MNSNNRGDMDMNDNLWYRDVSSGIGLIKIHTLTQRNKPSNWNGMKRGFENGDVIGGHCYIYSNTVSEASNKKYIYSTNESDKNNQNISEFYQENCFKHWQRCK